MKKHKYGKEKYAQAVVFLVMLFVLTLLNIKNAAADANMKIYFQDLKNYLAIKDLEKTKGRLTRELENAPFTASTVETVGKGNNIISFKNGMEQIVDRELVKYNLYMTNAIGTQSNFVLDHLNTFCNIEEQNLKICHSDNPIAAPIDLMASTLLGGSQFGSQSLQDTALRYIRNLINPVPVPMIEELTSTEAASGSKAVLTDKAVSHLAAKYKMAPALTLAQSSLQRMYVDRISLSHDGKANSLLRILEVESERRFFDPNWYSKISTKSQETIMRDMAQMMALQMVMNFRLNGHLERIEAMMASQLAQSMGYMGKGEAAKQAGSKAMEQMGGG